VEIVAVVHVQRGFVVITNLAHPFIAFHHLEPQLLPAWVSELLGVV
jgi:hypothetical protein